MDVLNQAIDLKDKLNSLGVKVVANIYDDNYSIIGHDYKKNFDIPEVVENLKMELEFFKEVTTTN